jgi:DNA-binding LytR/AlgR family response regulator
MAEEISVFDIIHPFREGLMRIAIVEDSLPDETLLEDLLKQYFLREKIKADITSYTSGEDFFVDWPLELDMVFLDIQMGTMNGIQVAEKIRETNDKVILVFLTNNPQYSLAGYSVEALDYLIKPVTPELLERLLSRVIRRLGGADHTRITIHNADGYFVINLADIQFFELENRRMIIHTRTGDISCQATIQSMEEQLPATFFRCHSAFLINLLAVESLKGQDAVVGGKLIPISKHRRREFIRALTETIGDTL